MDTMLDTLPLKKTQNFESCAKNMVYKFQEKNDTLRQPITGCIQRWQTTYVPIIQYQGCLATTSPCMHAYIAQQSSYANHIAHVFAMETEILYNQTCL